MYPLSTVSSCNLSSEFPWIDTLLFPSNETIPPAILSGSALEVNVLPFSLRLPTLVLPPVIVPPTSKLPVISRSPAAAEVKILCSSPPVSSSRVKGILLLIVNYD